MNSERKILLYKDYFLTFYRSLEMGAQKKIDYVLDVLKMQERVSEKFVKFIKDGLYEIRASYNGNIYRAFFIFDEGNIVMLFNGFKQFTDGITDTKTAMWILLGGNTLNIIGNYIFIYGKCGMPEMGLAGAGLSTLLSRIIMVIVYLVVFFKTQRYSVFREGFLRGTINRADFIHLNKLGWPIAGLMGMETASFSLSAVMVGWLGSNELASYQIMITVSQVCFMMYYGMGAAVSVRISNFAGQDDWRNAKLTANIGFHIILIMIVCTAIPIFLLRNHIGPWFTDDEAVAVMVAQTVIPFLVYQLGDGLQINFANALRGIADVRLMMLFAFIAYFVISLPLGYLFGFIFHWGIVGIWMAFPFGLTSAGIMYYLRFRYQINRKM